MGVSMDTAAFCPGCGTAITAGGQFCGSCGRRVGLAPPAATWSGNAGLEQGVAHAYAGFWLRWVASSIDLILSYSIGDVLGVVLGVVLGIVQLVFSDRTVGDVHAYLVGFFVNWLYYALMESSRYQGTVGKLVLGLIVTDEQYRPISFWRATGRYFGMIVSTIILFIGYLMAAFTARKQCLHDKMAGTLVVKKPGGYVRT